MKKIHKKKLTGLMVMMILALRLVSTCCTKPVIESNPNLIFYTVPAPIDNQGNSVVSLEKENGKSVVKMPLWYWKALTEFILKTEKTRKQYEEWEHHFDSD